MEKESRDAIECIGIQPSLFGENPPPTKRKRPKQFCAKYDELGRTRLSPNFILRDLLFSTDSAALGISNFPERPDLVIQAGKALCETLLEPVLAKFGRFAITFGYQSREGIEHGLTPQEKLESVKSSNPHQWDRLAPFLSGVYARVDILPFCVEDGHVPKAEFGNWLMHNLDIDLLMQWSGSSVHCISISPRPRRVWLMWGSKKRGEKPRTTFMGTEYWRLIYPTLPAEERPKFAPSMTGGRLWWKRDELDN